MNELLTHFSPLALKLGAANRILGVCVTTLGHGREAQNSSLQLVLGLRARTTCRPTWDPGNGFIKSQDG